MLKSKTVIDWQPQILGGRTVIEAEVFLKSGYVMKCGKIIDKTGDASLGIVTSYGIKKLNLKRNPHDSEKKLKREHCLYKVFV